MGEFAEAAAGLERQNREVLANQTSLRRSFEQLREEFRSRVGAHDTEFKEVRERLSQLEALVASLIDGPELEGKLADFQRQLAEFQTIVSNLPANAPQG